MSVNAAHGKESRNADSGDLNVTFRVIREGPQRTTTLQFLLQTSLHRQEHRQDLLVALIAKLNTRKTIVAGNNARGMIIIRPDIIAMHTAIATKAKN